MMVMLVSLLLDVACISGAAVQPLEAEVLSSSTPVSRSLPQWFPKAPPLGIPKGEVIQVATADDLLGAVENIDAGGTVLLGVGQYKLPRPIVLHGKKK